MNKMILKTSLMKTFHNILKIFRNFHIINRNFLKTNLKNLTLNNLKANHINHKINSK
jgi:hypothetical protein